MRVAATTSFVASTATMSARSRRLALETIQVSLESLFAAPPAEHVSRRYLEGVGERVIGDIRDPNGFATGIVTIVDRFDECSTCVFLRFDPVTCSSLTIALEGGYECQLALQGGWLLQSPGKGDAAYWIPRPAARRRSDLHGRVVEESSDHPVEFAMGATGAFVRFAGSTGALDIVIWKFAGGGLSIAAELLELPPDPHGVFLWGSHARLATAADVYRT